MIAVKAATKPAQIRLTSCLSLVLALACGTAHSQTAAAIASSGDLTLHDAVALALKQNIEVQIATLDSARRQQERVISRSDLLPHAELAASDAVTRYNLKARVGIQLPGVPHSIEPFQSLNQGIAFSGPVFDLTLIRRYQASGHRLTASKKDEQAVREETVFLTVSEYMAHLRALASVTAAESRVELAKSLAKQADDLRVDGVATRIDVTRAQVRVREEQQQLIDAQRDVQTTLFALKRILNLPDATQVNFADTKDFFSTPALDIAEPVETALANGSRSRLGMERWSWLPLGNRSLLDTSR